jgi:hypothetical protein
MPRLIKGHDDIVRGLNGYIQYWTAEWQRDVTGLYKYQYAHCIEYWSRVRYDTLFMGLWPQTRQSLEVRGMQAYGSISGEEFRGEEYYIGPRSQRPRPMYRIE